MSRSGLLSILASSSAPSRILSYSTHFDPGKWNRHLEIAEDGCVQTLFRQTIVVEARARMQSALIF